MNLQRIETYYDAVPRAAGTTEEVGPFTVFLAEEGTGWDFYARPRLGLDADVTPDDVRRVLARQTELGVGRAIEWVDEVTPSLLRAVREVTGSEPGYELEECRLLVLPDDQEPAGTDPRVRLLAADDPDLPAVVGAINAGFGDMDGFEPQVTGSRSGLIERGLLIVVGAYDDSGQVVGGGSASPRGDVAELMGIGVIPGGRRAGLGSATTAALVRGCRQAGVRTVFLSAASDDAASIYRALGFERHATACILGTRG